MERRGFIGALVAGLAATFIPATASAADSRTTVAFGEQVSLRGGRYVEDVPVSAPGLLQSEFADSVFLLNTSHSRIHARPLSCAGDGDKEHTWIVVRFATHDGSRLPKCDLTLWANVTGVWY